METLPKHYCTVLSSVGGTHTYRAICGYESTDPKEFTPVNNSSMRGVTCPACLEKLGQAVVIVDYKMEAKNYRLYIFDADGTLRRCTVPNQKVPHKPGEWELLPNVKERLSLIDWNISTLGIASNQASVARGYLSAEDAFSLLTDMVVEAFGFRPKAGTVCFCPHGVDDGCACRKPAAGMLWRVMELWHCLPEETLFVGDMESDQWAAVNAGCDFMYASDFFGKENFSNNVYPVQP